MTRKEMNKTYTKQIRENLLQHWRAVWKLTLTGYIFDTEIVLENLQTNEITQIKTIKTIVELNALNEMTKWIQITTTPNKVHKWTQTF